MTWNWQSPKWPNFSYDLKALEPLERDFLLRSGEFVGAFKHVDPQDQDTLKIELISDEALKTSQIEGEILNRDSVQSSLRAAIRFGTGRSSGAARGTRRRGNDGRSLQKFACPTDHETMFTGTDVDERGSDHRVIGGYRTQAEPMQVLSGIATNRTVHFEAPPSENVAENG